MKQNKQAFTLIELLVVVLIIGILAAIALPQYQKAVFKSHMAEAIVNLKTIANAVHMCELSHEGKIGFGDDNPCVHPENLDVQIGLHQKEDTNSFYTNSFSYSLDRGGLNYLDTVAVAASKKYEVCLCLQDNGHMAVSSGGDCSGKSVPPFDVNTVLGIEDDDCSCC